MRIGFLSLPVQGHLNPMTTLARQLAARGHESVLLGVVDAAPAAHAADLEFVAFAETDYPLGTFARARGPVSSLRGADAYEFPARHIYPRLVEMTLMHGPAAVRNAEIDAMVVDAAYPCASLLPISLRLPFAHATFSLPLDRSGNTPPSTVDWPYRTDEAALARNREALTRFATLAASQSASLTLGQAFADRHGLGIDVTRPETMASPFGSVTQLFPEFDFPGTVWPASLHLTGPFSDGGGRARVPFDWDALDGRPIVYASLGSVFNGLPTLWRAIVGAASLLPTVQFICPLGDVTSRDALGDIPPAVVTVPFAPQLSILARATLCITHAGFNTTLESLSAGVPMVALPLAHDQPGVASRIAHHGAGVKLDAGDITSVMIADAVRHVLADERFARSARRLRDAIDRRGGLDRAANLIEAALGQAPA